MDARATGQNYTGWQSDVIVDLIKRYGFPVHHAQSRRELPRPARLARQLRRQRAADDAVPARGDRGADRARLRQGDRQADGGDPAQSRRPAACLHGDLLRLSRPRADLHHRRHRPDGRGQAPSAHRLDAHRAGAGQRGARLHQVGLPADLDRRRAGKLRARLFDHDDRAAGPDLHVLRRRAAGGAARPRGAAAAGRRRRDAGARWRPIRRRSRRSPTSCSRPSIRCCCRNMPAAARAASRASWSSPRRPARRCGTSTTRSIFPTSIRCA